MKRRIVINLEFTELTDFVARIEREFDGQGEEIFRRRNIVKIFTYNDVEVAVKSYKSPNLFQKVLNFFGKTTKARRAYENGLRLKSLGFRTPEPIGYVETFRLRIPQRTFFITAKVEEVSFKEIVLSKVNIEYNLDQLAQFVARLHKNDVFFRDLNLDNILVDPKDIDEKKFVLIDTNRVHFCKINQERRVQDIARLSRNYWVIEGFITRYCELMGLDVEREKMAVRRAWEKRENRNHFMDKIRKPNYAIRPSTEARK